MTPDQRQEVLAMARIEFGHRPISWLIFEKNRKKLLDERHIFGYILSEGEMLALFETLIQERRCPKSTIPSCAATAGGTGTTKKIPLTPDAPNPDATATT